MRKHCRLPLVPAAVALCATVAAPFAPAAGKQSGSPGSGWTQYNDPRYHFSFVYPAGWPIEVDARHILVQSPDHSAFALVENFKPNGDETAEDHVDDLPKTDGNILRNATLKDAYTLGDGKASAGQGEQALGVLNYQGTKGPSQARALCFISPAGGIVFALGAGQSDFRAAQPTLTHVLQSLRFSPAGPGPAAQPSDGGQVNGASAGSSAFVSMDPTSTPDFVHWADPVEGAFSTAVPKGWKIEGGLNRADLYDDRMAVLARSPHDEMAVMIGDSALPSFDLPSMYWQMHGKHEGDTVDENSFKRVLLHYMPATEFNHWYLQNFLSRAASDIQIGEDKDMPQIGEQMTTNANKQGGPGQFTVTCCLTQFTGRSKLNGREMAGVLVSTSSELVTPRGGNWTAHPVISVWATGDGKEDARRAVDTAVVGRMNKSWQMNSQWVAKVQSEQKQALAAMTAANAARRQAIIASQASRSQQLSRSNAVGSDDRRAHMMGSFRAQMAAKDNMTRKMQNYSLDQTDVSDGSSSWKVGSGYSNYYHNSRTGTIVGTNDPGNPGPDFTPLGQY